MFLFSSGRQSAGCSGVTPFAQTVLVSSPMCERFSVPLVRPEPIIHFPPLSISPFAFLKAFLLAQAMFGRVQTFIGACLRRLPWRAGMPRRGRQTRSSLGLVLMAIASVGGAVRAPVQAQESLSPSLVAADQGNVNPLASQEDPSGANSSSANPPSSSVEKLGIPYLQDVRPELLLDIYLPVAPKPDMPLIVVIPGVGWQFGSRLDVTPFARRFVDHQIVVAAVDFRRSPAHIFPAAVDDCREAVRFLRAHASDYGYSPNAIGLMGVSSGGHLALLTALMDDPVIPQEGQAVVSAKVQAVAAFFAPTDLQQKFAPESQHFVDAFLGNDPNLAQAASPIHYLSAGDPPILLMQGLNDPYVPFAPAVEFAQKMNEFKIEGRLELISNVGHGWSGKEEERSLRAALRFLVSRAAQ